MPVSPFCYPKVKENKMKPWKRHVLTTHTICKHCWLVRYETDMGPELFTAAADQNFAWICKQHQDLIGSVLIFRTKIIWSGPEFGLVRCGYLNAAIVYQVQTRTSQILKWFCTLHVFITTVQHLLISLVLEVTGATISIGWKWARSINDLILLVFERSTITGAPCTWSCSSCPVLS